MDYISYKSPDKFFFELIFSNNGDKRTIFMDLNSRLYKNWIPRTAQCSIRCSA